MQTKLLFIGMLFCFSSHGQGKFFGGSGDGFSTASTTNVVLPLQVIEFTANADKDVVSAYLAFRTTEPVCAVRLERSANGLPFKTVDSTEKLQPGITESRFRFTDQLTTNGLYYYRAKIIRCSGNAVFSNIHTVNRAAQSNRFYYVSSGQFKYDIKQNGQLELYNMPGQLVYQTLLISGSGIFTIPNISAGVYIIRFSNEFIKRIFIPSF